MFSNKAARQMAASLCLLGMAALSHADEKHLTLDDIDGLARQKLVDSMRKTDGGQAPASGVSLNAPIAAPTPAPDPAPAPTPKAPRRVVSPVRQTTPVKFVGAFSDMSGSHVLYDYQGGIYPAQRGAKLLNGWTVTRVDGYQVTVADGKRTWTEVISTPSASITPIDGPAIQAITDLGGPLPPPTIAVGAPATASFGR
jgi:hypothetical protein